jgi:hypothetical protein
MYLTDQANQIRRTLTAGMTLPDDYELPKMWVRSLTFIVPLLFLAAVIFQPWVEPKWMFLDPLTAAQLSGECCSTYFGFASNLGILIWSATAAICLFSAGLFALLKADRALTWFALSSGILTGWLALDDTFLVHETVMPSLGVPQNAVIAAYAALALLYIASSWRVILASDFWILLIGGLALVVSILVDTVFHSLAPSLVYIEDSAKFFGIFCWASFHITTLFERVSSLAVRK